MPKFTKHPEQCPVEIALSKIAAFHPWEIGGDMCVKIILDGGVEIHVADNMREVSQQLPATYQL